MGGVLSGLVGGRRAGAALSGECWLLSLHLFGRAAATRPPVCPPEGSGGDGMVLLGLLQTGGSVLGQAVEQVTGGSLLSTLLVACVFTLSLAYLFRLAVGHLVFLPVGAVRASNPGRAGGRRGPVPGAGGSGRGPDGRGVVAVATAPLVVALALATSVTSVTLPASVLGAVIPVAVYLLPAESCVQCLIRGAACCSGGLRLAALWGVWPLVRASSVMLLVAVALGALALETAFCGSVTCDY